MKILQKAFGDYATNCYIFKVDGGEIVIDPGDGSYNWIKKNCNKILGILATHGHFDHIYDCALLQKDGYKIYINEKDNFLLENDPFENIKIGCKADVLVKDGDEFCFGNSRAKFHEFSGHTPGCSMIEVENFIFSGDFLFRGSIGRYDFLYSNKNDMKKSLEKVKNFNFKFDDYLMLPGHGERSFLRQEIKNIDYFLRYF